MSASCECCVLSNSGLGDGPITRPEESYRECVCVCVSYGMRSRNVNNKVLAHLSCPAKWGGGVKKKPLRR
jgi:hypothetical protein